MELLFRTKWGNLGTNFGMFRNLCGILVLCRFLNEMIKLVSPKYLGSRTPLSVKQRVLQLLYLWTLDYPKEVKIKEAFDMLRKQGVIREIPNPNIPQEALGKNPFFETHYVSTGCSKFERYYWDSGNSKRYCFS